MKSVLMMEMTTDEVKEYLLREETVMMPVGSCEQHGSYAPLGTDSFITQEISQRVGEKLGIVVTPMIPVGLSDQHLAWPGTLSLSIGTITNILTDYVDSLFSHGFRKFLLHYFHTKNKIAVDAAAWKIKKRYGDKIKILVVNSFASWSACSGQIFGEEHDTLWTAHGGEGEVSCLEALGWRIKNSKIPERIENSEFLNKSRNPEVYAIIQNLKKYTPAGVWGEASGTSREEGEKIFEIVSTHLAKLIPAQWEE
ncbi:MAG: creatininase family protein [Deltaproteobacteria bacterium]|nr:creatininase family protein [Deltaproteobacteria bacterium]MBW2308752.1 creatininase family protein [Deltaproteobacteria bacterium]